MKRAVCVLLCLLCAAGTVGAADEVDPALEAALHLKVLSYDRALKKRTGGALVIAVVHATGDEAAARRISTALATLGGKMTVQEMKPSVVVVPYDAASLAQDLAARKATVIYATPALRDAVPALAATRLATLGSDRASSEKGVAVTVVKKGGKPHLIINLKAARAAGMDLDPQLLRLAEVLK